MNYQLNTYYFSHFNFYQIPYSFFSFFFIFKFLICIYLYMRKDTFDIEKASVSACLRPSGPQLEPQPTLHIAPSKQVQEPAL